MTRWWSFEVGCSGVESEMDGPGCLILLYEGGGRNTGKTYQGYFVATRSREEGDIYY